MEKLSPTWKNYPERIEQEWRKCISAQDLVLIPGDISWAMTLEEALIDLEWIHSLPGTKVLLRGNHDYWWSSLSKMQKVLPSSIHCIHNNIFSWKGVFIGGSRLWDTTEYNFSHYTEFVPNSKERIEHRSYQEKQAEDEKIFCRELERLRLSLSQIPPAASCKIALTHYPPIGADLHPSRVSAILEEYGIDYCVFGHLHSIKEHSLPFGKARGVEYIFASCDYTQFTPLLIKKLPSEDAD